VSGRLTHSRGGYLRYMQMSQTRLFIFVEGWSDTFFYSSLAALHCNPGGLRYELATPKALPGSAFGKPALLEFLEFLRKT